MTRTRFLTVLVLSASPAVAQAFPQPPVPPGNPITTAKVNLGKTLFWDEQMSSTKTVACATCHMPESGGSDPRSLAGSVNPGPDGVFGTPDDVRGSRGVIGNTASGRYRPVAPFGLREQVTTRKAPSAINAAFNRLQFWDGRAGEQFVDPVTGQVVLGRMASLETQAIAPPVSDVEMAHAGRDWSGVAATIAAARPLALASELPAALASWLGNRSYPDLFREAFGTPDVTAARILMAIATYERTLISNQAPFDRFLQGQPNALTPQEQRGLQVFNGPARCNTCHVGPLLTNMGFFNIGVRPTPEDLGRGAITGQPIDNGAFKVPSLRNAALRAPFFHSGRFDTLTEVVRFYQRGGDFHRNQTPLIRPFQISPMDQQALIAFLTNALTDPRVAAGLPPFDHPTLYRDSFRTPTRYGQGSPAAPHLVAIEPPVLGNDNMTLGLDAGLPGAPAFLMLDVAPSATGIGLPGAPLWLAATPSLTLLRLGPLDAAGTSSLVAHVPADNTLIGESLYLQSGTLAPMAPSGVVTSEAVRMTFFAPR